jgi:sugar phosphate isomerase/epimerase
VTVNGLTCDWTMWWGKLGRSSWPERIAATAEVGYRSLSVDLADVARWATEGAPAPRVLARQGEAVRGAGLAVASLDALASWTHVTDRTWAGAAVEPERALDWAADLGAAAVTLVAMGPTNDAILAADLATACSRASERGLAVLIEFGPVTAIRNLSRCQRIVAASGVTNCHIVLDTWHFFRGGSLLSDVAVAAPLIRGVQVSDAHRAVEGTLEADTFRHRLPPGHGDFDLVGLLGELHRAGALRSVGPEVLSSALRSVPPLDAAREVTAALDRVLAEAIFAR